MHWGMTARSAVLAAIAALAAGILALSGGHGADPRTPPPLPGLPPPFLGVAVAGSGGASAAVDAYGNVVDLRPGPAGPALIANPSPRQAAGTVDPRTGIVPRVNVGGGTELALWEADAVRQRYLPGTNVVRTVARFGTRRVVVTVAATGERLAVSVATPGAGAGAGAPEARTSAAADLDGGVRCERRRSAGRLDLVCAVGGEGAAVDGGTAPAMIRAAARADRVWLARSRALGPGAPAWATGLYERSLLTLRALTDSRSGASAAGARDGWAYVWPRDAGAAAIALAAAGHRREARLATRFLLGADLSAAARFRGDGSPVPGRAAQGDASGWTAAAAGAAGLSAAPGQAERAGRAPERAPSPPPTPWRDRADYQEGDPGDYLANAIASGAGVSDFDGPIGPSKSDTPRAAGLVRRAGDPGSGLDSAAAWAVRPFPRPALYPRVRRTLVALLGEATPYGITPGAGWRGGADPWMAPTAWSAWAFAALARSPGSPNPSADRRRALALLAALRRAATPAGALPERVDARTGLPTSTTPLAWPHAFAALTLLELWPPAESDAADPGTSSSPGGG